ncbi:hypothetical protein [Citrobacter koseri]|uniref:hypothetical protein n=1 Tax=Citrobacter koseri TaxID=545 RepID=UPI001B8E4E48|nr:hypothetical protein [Citrobacter koseri]MDT7458903.1 hypothetical protein [Citrobacter koseri]MEB2773317.1 hypothetical protein [Citrobacter koseri]WOJ26901.1 hypothetical protein R1221_03330 [Citrobacter koseri]HBC5670600.1 hypothetical protein [Citrobacter koseri]
MTDKKTAKEPEVITEKPKTCFVMMPIADHPDYEPGHFNRVYQYLIKPACVKAGYQPIRADDNKASNMIMFDILKKIVDCDMAICDLSSRNANVFYELGLRQAFNKKTILITDNILPAPFDISAFRYVSYSPTLRVDTVDREIPGIISMLKETENQPADDVNSIIKLLQIQPSKVENISLNEEESVLYGMLLNLQKQIAEINKPKLSSNFHKYFLDLQTTNHKHNVNLEEVDLSGLNFPTIQKSFPEYLSSTEFMYKKSYLGIMKSIDEHSVKFIYNGNLTDFPNDDKILKNIYAA